MELIFKKEIKRELAKKDTENKKMLKILVEERIKDISNNYFKISEIIFWSERFCILEEDFILKVLMIRYDEYNKFLKNKNVTIKSNAYNTVKEEIIKKKKKSYMKNINMNIRNYYNKIKLIEDSSKMYLNIVDFSIHILKKPRHSLNRVLKAKNSKSRLHIGEYANSELPKKYIESNIEAILVSIQMALKNAIVKLGLVVSKEDYEDKINDGFIFISENGNNLDINNNEIINNENLELIKKHRRIFYWKSFYYYLNNFKKNILVREVEFIENISYNFNSIFTDVSEFNNTDI